ncbi:hypothetical protein NHX12_023491 [Muraenolepis orangiensis]|uniref:Uncharacterized protein n=1 Tax=Muraenolepis orangiensis TaxID=630683 RepID=A0A9Q0EM66_9TELE|nr:hypothetical protein NHX12_023491 [Muraenolepis orangiensis]
MPRRSSTGELVPKDISEILAREARAHRGQRKPGGPLGQAFCWLKGSRKKKKTSSGTSSTCSSISNALNGVGTTGTAADTAEDCQNHAPAKEGPECKESFTLNDSYDNIILLTVVLDDVVRCTRTGFCSPELSKALHASVHTELGRPVWTDRPTDILSTDSSAMKTDTQRCTRIPES